MIRIYPSRQDINLYPSMEGQSYERHDIDGEITIHEWMSALLNRNVKPGEPPRFPHESGIEPLSIDVNGKTVPPEEWISTRISQNDDVRIYPIPYAAGAAFFAAYGAYIAVAVAAIALVYALSISTESPDGNQISGDRLDLNPAKANGVKLHDDWRDHRSLATLAGG